jgi:hypothetical protein
MWFTAQDNGYRGWFIVKDNAGNLRTGLAAGDFTVTVIEPNDGDSNNPSVSESGELSGTYYFDVPSAFLITYGNGEYNVTVEVNTFAGPSGPPNVRDVINSVLQVSTNDFDDISSDISDLSLDLADVDVALETSRFDAVYISAAYGVAGTTGDIGTRQNPVSNIGDATTIAAARKIRRFVFIDTETYTLTQAYVNWVFEGENFAFLNLNGQNVAGSMISRLTVVGQGSPAGMFECYVTSVVLGGTATFRCIFAGNSTLSSNCTLMQTYFVECNLTISGGSHQIANGSGILGFVSCNTGTHRINNFQGKLTLGVSCTGGAFVLDSGEGRLIDISNGSTVSAAGFNDVEAQIAERGRVVAGGDDTNFYTNMTTFPGGYFDGMKVVVVNVASGATVARNLTNFTQANGEIQVDVALPFTPAVNDKVFIIPDNYLVELFDEDALVGRFFSEQVPGTYNRGSFADVIGRGLHAQRASANAGSTPTSIRTSLTQVDGFFNNMQVVVEDSSGIVVRNINQYNQTNGEIVVDALPFTPQPGYWVTIMSRVASASAGGVWTVAEKNQVIADTAFTKEFTSGRWWINNNQMIFYKSDGSELMRFNLFAEDGTPAMEDIFQRRPV